MLRRTDGSSLAALIQQVRAAVLQAALGSGATSPPVVTVVEVPAPGRRRLATSSGASPTTALLVTVTFSPEDSAPAQQLGNTLLSQPLTVLPPGQFGSLEVQSVALDDQPVAAAPPPPGGARKTAVIAGAVGGSAFIVLAGRCNNCAVVRALLTCCAVMACPLRTSLLFNLCCAPAAQGRMRPAQTSLPCLPLQVWGCCCGAAAWHGAAARQLPPSRHRGGCHLARRACAPAD